MCKRSNLAAAYLALGMWDEALQQAERALVLAEAALKRRARAAGPLYAKAFVQKGAALIGLPYAMFQSGSLVSRCQAEWP